MADGDQNFLTFGPLFQTAGWDLTTGPGIQPGSCAVTFRSSELQLLGSPVQDLTLYQGNTELFRLPSCHLLRRQQATPNAKLTKCQIVDRRWRWQFAYIDGVYNVPKGTDGKTFEREKTPQQLASLLLDAMGEVGYDVSLLPNDARPYVNWQSSRADQALMSLCSSLGCYPSLNYLTDFTEIHRIGGVSSFDATNWRIITQGAGAAVKPAPASIRVVGGRSLFQSLLELEAVGVDTDGSIKRFEDLSYISSLAAGRIEKEFPPDFANIKGTYKVDGKDVPIRDLAGATCYKLFRIKGQAYPSETQDASPWSPEALVGTEYEPTRLEELLPLRGVKLSTHTNAAGVEEENTATVHGEFYRELLDLEGVKDGTQYPVGGYSIDGPKGLVRFAQPVYILEDGKVKLPRLVLDTSYPVNKDGVWVRWEQFVNSTDPDAFGSFRHSSPELISKVSETPGDTLDNRSQIAAEAEFYLDAIVRRYLDVKLSYEVTASRIEPVSIDGQVRQITWSGGSGRPATTRVSLNTEHHNYIPRYETQEKKAIEATASDVAMIQHLERLAAG